MSRIVRTGRLCPDLIQQARKPESRLRKLMTRDRVGVVEVSRVQFDRMPHRIDADIGCGLARFDGNLKRTVDIGARHLIRLPRDIVRGNPRIGLFLSRICSFQLVGRRLRTSGIDAVLETTHDGGVPGRMKVGFSRTRIDLDAIAAEVRVVRGMQWLMDVADKMNQKRQIAFGAPSIIVALLSGASSIRRFSRSRIFHRGIVRECRLADPANKCR